MVRLGSKGRSEVAEHIKKVACRLFAERGVDGVTVRQIAEASGQKNHGAVGYHFGSKEALVHDLVVDGAILIDERRNRAMDALEGQGGPSTVREVVDLIVYSSIDVAGGPLSEESYVRFVVMLNMTHKEFFYDALEDRWNSGYLRCLEHLRRLMPEMPSAEKNQRFLFLGAAVRGILSMRESALADTTRPHRMWTSPATLQHCVQVLTAMIEAPFDAGALAASADADHGAVLIGPIGLVPQTRETSDAA